MTRLNWGMIGGGEGSQIGPAHRLAAGLDGYFTFAAGALDHDPARGRDFGQRLGLAADRAYGDWREMLAGEQGRPDRVDLVTVATPNSTHYDISKAFLAAGFNVLCEKPMTVTEAEAEDLVLTARKAGRICAVNYGYTGYALVRHMRAMVARGDIGKVRLVVAEFAHGHHANAADADNPRVRWRYDPAQAGVSAQFADCGIHALHMASFVTGQEVARLSSDFASCLPSRVLEDDAMVNFRMEGGTDQPDIVGRLWTSSVAIGRQHGLTIQVFGETGGLRWAQEQPNQLYYMPLGQRLQVGREDPRQPLLLANVDHRDFHRAIQPRAAVADALQHVDGRVQHVVGGDGGVGQRDALHARMRDVPLVPQWDALGHRRHVPADHPGEAGDPLGADGVLLVRHR